MDFMPPAHIVKVSDPRWSRWIIKDGIGQYWAGEHRWSDKPAAAILFSRAKDALATIERCGLGDGMGNKFTVTVVVTANGWTVGELATFLHEHSEFSLRDSAVDEELLFEIVPETLKRADECGGD